MRSRSLATSALVPIRRDAATLLRAITPHDTLQAASQLKHFEAPVLLAWAREDRYFPLDHARRLAALLPIASIQQIEDSYTFLPKTSRKRCSAQPSGPSSPKLSRVTSDVKRGCLLSSGACAGAQRHGVAGRCRCLLARRRQRRCR